MKTVKTLITISALLLGSVPVFAASHAGAPMAKDEMKKEMPMAMSKDMTDGEIRKVDMENKKITIKHGEIKNLDMPGMTMVFKVKDLAMLDKLQVGSKVRFKAEKSDGAMVVTSMELAQ